MIITSIYQKLQGKTNQNTKSIKKQFSQKSPWILVIQAVTFCYPLVGGSLPYHPKKVTKKSPGFSFRIPSMSKKHPWFNKKQHSFQRKIFKKSTNPHSQLFLLPNFCYFFPSTSPSTSGCAALTVLRSPSAGRGSV